MKNGNIIVIDLLREWRPIFKAHKVVDEIRNLCMSYCIDEMISDKTGKWVEDQFTLRAGLILQRRAPRPNMACT